MRVPGCFVAPSFCDASIKLKKKPTEYLDQIYFDSLVFTPEALRHLVAQVGATRSSGRAAARNRVCRYGWKALAARRGEVAPMPRERQREKLREGASPAWAETGP
jgi:hypothetical protein